MGRVTVKEVAAEAGVSTASVSRVLAGGRPVSLEIAERVHRAAADLGYEVNTVGRSLRRQSTDTVGFVVADVTNPYFPELIKEVEMALSARGLGLVLADAANDVTQEKLAVSRLLARQVDALLITPVSRSRSRALVADASQRCTVVQLDRRASSRTNYIGMDNRSAIQSVLEHLASNGRKRPVFIGSDPQISTTWERQRGFESFSPSPDRVLVGDFSLDWGRRAALLAVECWPDVDALVCADDLIAVGALECLVSLGLKVPDDIALTGFDDTLLARLGNPPVTSVRQPLQLMAEAAATLVSMPGNNGVTVERFPGELMVRASSAAHRAKG